MIDANRWRPKIHKVISNIWGKKIVDILTFAPDFIEKRTKQGSFNYPFFQNVESKSSKSMKILLNWEMNNNGKFKI